MPPWPNCMVLVAPLLVFSLVLARRLPEDFAGDGGIPRSLRFAENAFRAVVFVVPLWLDFDPARSGPLAWFAAGAALYMASWVPPLLGTSVARRRLVYLLPYATPLIWLLAVAWMGRSRPYTLASMVFVAVHTAHGILAHRRSPPRGSSSSPTLEATLTEPPPG